MHQRTAEPKAPDLQRMRLEQRIPERRTWLPVAGMFVLLCILILSDEILDIPHILLGASRTPINWAEAITEMVLVGSVGLLVVLMLIRDIAQRERSEDALREAELRYRTIANFTYDWEYWEKPDGTLNFVSPACERITGYAASQFMDNPALLQETISPEDREVWAQHRRCAREAPGLREVRFRMRRADGKTVWIEHACQAVTDDKGVFLGFRGSNREITERKRTEKVLEQHALRLRAVAARLAEVTEVERQRLARELHDQVGQDLTALGINLNIVRSQMLDEAAPAAVSRLDDSLLLVEQTTERIRDLMANLRPPVLDDYGLVAALHWYADQFSRRTDIAVTVEGEEPVPRLGAGVENALFRIAQEALTNVAKHAQATQVTMTVVGDDGILRLRVTDDGVGFDAAPLADPNRGGGWGLLIMTERAEAVGGHCRIESAPGQGAQVIVEVPR